MYSLTKVRVYELAKELKITSKELIEKVADLNLDINSHMSTVEKEEADLIKELLRTESDSEINNSKNTSNVEKRQRYGRKK